MSNSSTNSIMPCFQADVKGLSEQALTLASKGYPVFPLKPGTKEPATANGFRDATTDHEQIKRWWAENPNFNIGIAAPNLLVIDLDAYKPETQASKERLFGSFVPADIPVAQTPRGGFHYYLRVDTDWAAEWGIGNNVSVLPGIDLKGCGKGYVVGPGSVVDGRCYELAGGWTELPPLEQLPKLPEQARQAIEQAISSKKPAEPNRNGHKPAAHTHQETAPADPELLERLSEALPTIWQEGRRQELALGISGMLRKLGYDEADVADLIATVAAQQGDPEIGKRVLAVRDTYAKPIEQIAGMSLLTDDEKQALEPILRQNRAWGRGETISAEHGRILRAVDKQLGWCDARYNVARYQIEILAGGEWRRMSDGDVSALAFVVLPYRVGEAVVWRPVGKERAYDAIAAYAYQNEYDPIADLLLNQLPQWDGRDRIAELAAHIIHSMPTLPNGADPVETFLRKWLVGAVARALAGEQNFVIVLIGRQGIGKSQLARWIAPSPELFSDGPIDPDSRESVVQAGQVLIHELAELGAVTRRKDVDALKRFLSASTTDVRLPYARTSTCIRHRASYLATANDAEHLLRDSTGNRRFVALRIDTIDWAYAQIDKQQLWAQAVALYRAGWDYHLTDQEKEYQTQTNAKHEALRSGSIGDIMLELLDDVEELTRPQTIPLQAIHLLPPEPLAQEYLRLIGAEDGSMAAVAPIGVVSPTGEIAIWASQLANLAARVIRGGDANRYLQEINALVSRAGGRISERREINGVRRRCAVLTVEQAQALIDYLS